MVESPTPHEKNTKLWTANQIALITLITGVISSFSWSILGGFLLAGINWVRLGKTRKALLNVPVAIFFSWLFIYTGFGRVPLYLANPLPSPVVVIIYFTLAFVTIAYLHTQLIRDHAQFAAQGKRVEKQSLGLAVLTSLLGFPLFVVLILGNIYLVRAVGLCDFPSVYALGTIFNGPRFEGLASGLIQLDDFSCDWSWGMSEVIDNDQLSQYIWTPPQNSAVVDRVYHDLAGHYTKEGTSYYFLIKHYVQKQTSLVTEDNVQSFIIQGENQPAQNLLSLALDLEPHGNIQLAHCREESLMYCDVAVGYDYVVSYFDIIVEAPPEVVEEVLNFLLTATDARIQQIDSP